MRMVQGSVQVAILVILGSLVVGCGSYGEKMEFNKGELYYTEGVSEADAKKLGEYLIKDGYFDGAEKSVQLQKRGDHFVFRPVILEQYLNDSSIASVFEIVGGQISNDVFNGAPVDIELTDDQFETKKVIPFNPAAAIPPAEALTPDTNVVSSGSDSM